MRRPPLLVMLVGFAIPPVGYMMFGAADEVRQVVVMPAPAMQASPIAAKPLETPETTKVALAVAKIASPAKVTPIERCDRYAIPVPVPKRNSPMDDMEAKNAQALKIANDQLLAVRRCLRNGQK